MPQKAKRTRSAPSSGKPSRIDAVRHLVGVLTDAEVAAQAGVTSSAVHQYRQRHGIGPALPQGTTRRSVERRKAAAEERGGKESAGVEERLAAHVNQLGQVSDDSIARRAKVRASEVTAYRERLGIAPFTPKRGRPPGGEGRRSRIDDFRDIVGVLTDPEVAAQAGVTRTAVQMYRKKHGIPPAGPPGDPAVARGRAPDLGAVARPAVAKAIRPQPAAHRAAAPRSSGRVFAWKLTLASGGGEVVRIAVAEDAASACARASAMGEVVQVERLAEAIP